MSLKTNLFKSLTGAALTLALAVLAAGCHTAARQEAVRLKVMSYNIRVGIGGGKWSGEPAKINLEPVAQVIASQSPDIVGLQEVDQFRERSVRMDQPAWLSERLKMKVAYAPAYAVPKAGAPDEKYGAALLTRPPILAESRFPLFKPDYRQSHPEYPDYYSEQRVLLYAPVKVGGRQVHVFVTHLGLTPDQREQQLKQLAEITARYPGPKLLMGDFNAPPSEGALALLRPFFQDVFTATGTTPEGHKSFPAGAQPKNAIDYIFASPEFRVVSAKVIHDTSLASDHNPVIAEVELLPQ